MQLQSILRNLDYTEIKGSLDVEVTSIAYDSREVTTNGVFVAISGFTVDGHDYIENAIKKGATVIIVERDIWLEDYVTIIKVSDTRLALARMSANFYDNPTEKLNLIGITGTNGKTSTTYFVKSIFEQAKKSIGLIGTMGTIINNRHFENKNTTPESLNLQGIFSKMVDEGIEDCIMEVSSHALDLNRVAYCDFNTAIFTNLTPDHLELHKNMEEYFNAKAKLFDLAQEHLVINIDDTYGRRLIDRVKDSNKSILTYGINQKADIYPTDLHFYADYSTYQLNTPTGSVDIKVNIPGVIYVYNSLAAIAAAYTNQMSLEDIKEGIDAVKGIRGRLEVIYQDKARKVVVDFAHTEDGLEKALSSLRPYTKGRLIVVFGVYAAPGKDGSDKRRAMGKVAATYADLSIVTSDNPKEQDPNIIAKEIVESMNEVDGKYHVEIDRREAIKYAIENSQEGDVILLAGKGHETAQVIGNKEIPFNEKEIVNELLANIRKNRLKLQSTKKFIKIKR
ncbi:UDP-N-acetylmuramoyl-L-alanyl-D-glutamate--2,6-diaminopimelate ligase [Bacillus sp. HNG]|uniref:UDP-N-acetylmuramoyl-L-alanyl-D-glutamate--2, 6-diaminopimelate ligase n=1 Tax=Bacillus sp. HNG TaxID=2293325 RepID=UPI000E2F96A0|nr:UDP-N-acetylmuramoyl-L-alanyl-D-glutamate--2,6-diaminopimelate ligase [Bacillus sp. HNG]RFB12577.1 UDP-N-acetylmuramoyl-L-alanyl-D-glutamate--2,6-diaminopimelate ligase [Bacillus sp. HNG]